MPAVEPCHPIPRPTDHRFIRHTCPTLILSCSALARLDAQANSIARRRTYTHISPGDSRLTSAQPYSFAHTNSERRPHPWSLPSIRHA